MAAPSGFLRSGLLSCLPKCPHVQGGSFVVRCSFAREAPCASPDTSVLQGGGAAALPSVKTALGHSVAGGVLGLSLLLPFSFKRAERACLAPSNLLMNSAGLGSLFSLYSQGKLFRGVVIGELIEGLESNGTFYPLIQSLVRSSILFRL